MKRRHAHPDRSRQMERLEMLAFLLVLVAVILILVIAAPCGSVINEACPA